MIAIANQKGELLRVLPDESSEFGLHSFFGFISKTDAESRAHRRRAHGMKSDLNQWLCQLKLVKEGNRFDVSSINGCEVKKVSDQRWTVKTGDREFSILPSNEAILSAHLIDSDAEDHVQDKRAIIAVAILMLLMPVLFGKSKPAEDLVLPMIEPITVRIEPQIQKAVVVPSSVPVETAQNVKTTTNPDQQVKRAIQQNLGFLGLLGNKNLTKAIGGAPTKVKDASAGAGAGGNAGSGGEYLVGLGQGVKQASVGNTGVSGLGGIGTKGAGGGAGGYGNSSVGSGEGRSLSKVALSQDLVLEGGLDRAVIQATIAKYLSQVRACYEAGLQSNPGLAGQVNVNFVIAGDGAVSTSNVAKSSLGNTGVEGCITSKMLNWKFPKPVGGVNVKVNYPFVLRPVGA